MIRIQGNIHRSISVACSGGVDSMAVVDFLSRNHDVQVLFFHHGTKTSEDSREFLLDYCSKKNLRIRTASIQNKKKPNDLSQEEHWRNERYSFFHSVNGPVITCHHLNDCVETWIFSCLHGEGKIIPYNHKNVIRPFRLTKKKEFVRWCEKNELQWVEDSSNDDTRYMRNLIRQEMMPLVERVNPGIEKTVARRVENDAP